MTLNYIISIAETSGAEGMLEAFSRNDIEAIYSECKKLLSNLDSFPPIYTVDDIVMLTEVCKKALEI